MAEAFKNLIDARLVADLGHHLQRAWPGFARARFEAAATAGLDALELKPRVLHLARQLVAHLPADAATALATLTAALGPPGEGDDLASLRTSAAGLAGWAVWPMTEAVALIALTRPADHPQAEADAAQGLTALHAMTQRLTAEFAIRPFLVRHPALSLATLARWCDDPSAHVRRLVSEGSRPRLPWGLRLQALVKDPSPTLPLLRRLQDDPSAYVRRSVANHLNDIAKDHPALLADWLAQHLPGAPAERRALLRHASRSLVKAGDVAVLAAWGLGAPFKGRAVLAALPARLVVGDSLPLQMTLRSTARQPQTLVVDYAVHHAGAHGPRAPKVFKGWTLQLAAGEERVLSRSHSLKPVTTRRYHAGSHVLDVRINGQVVAEGRFDLALGG